MIDGEVDLLVPTRHWLGQIRDINAVEEFYVRVKLPGYGYVADNGKDLLHARFLRIKNKSTAFTVLPPKNRTPTKIGLPDANITRVEPCTFKKIVTYENGEPKAIFDERKLLNLQTDKDNFYTLKKIYYDYDKSELRSDALPVLKEIAKFLLESPYLPVEIGAHTDIRGKEDYNIKLSQQRAQSVVDYLINQGINKNRITAKGFSIKHLIYKGENISEELHQRNRRTTLEFKVHGTNAKEIILETLAPTSDNPKNYKIKIEERNNIKCNKYNDKHSRVKKIKELSHLHLNRETTQDTDEINYSIYSPIRNSFPRNYLEDLLYYLVPGIDYVNNFYFYINSCRYYSSKNQATIRLKAYPDIVWIGHFQYNYYETNKDLSRGVKKDYFFHSKKVELTNGITEAVEMFSKKVSSFFFELIPSSWLSENVLIAYIKSQATVFDYGFHAVHNRQQEKPGEALVLNGTNTDFINDTSYSRYIAAYVIYKLALVQIGIDLLFIYLTRGRNLTGKVAKLGKRLNKVIKYMDDNNIELIPPSIAVNAGMYYYMQGDRRMAMIYELNIKADPLVEVRFKQDFDLINGFLKGGKSKNNPVLAEKLIRAGVTTLKGTFNVEGTYDFEDNIKLNVLTNTYSLGKRMKHLIALSSMERVINKDIKVKITLDIKYDKEFDFFGINTDIQGKMKLFAEGGAGLKIRGLVRLHRY